MLACDGIWDVLDNESCLKMLELLVTKLLKEKTCKGLPHAMARACEVVLDDCLNRQSTDNMSLMAVQLSGG